MITARNHSKVPTKSDFLETPAVDVSSESPCVSKVSKHSDLIRVTVLNNDKCSILSYRTYVLLRRTANRTVIRITSRDLSSNRYGTDAGRIHFENSTKKHAAHRIRWHISILLESISSNHESLFLMMYLFSPAWLDVFSAIFAEMKLVRVHRRVRNDEKVYRLFLFFLVQLKCLQS